MVIKTVNMRMGPVRENREVMTRLKSISIISLWAVNVNFARLWFSCTMYVQWAKAKTYISVCWYGETVRDISISNLGYSRRCMVRHWSKAVQG